MLERHFRVRIPKWVRGIVVALLVLLAPVAAHAQTGSIRVEVYDSDGAPLPGATVTLSNEQRLIAPTTSLSDAAGLSFFAILKAGAGYAVEVVMPGFGTQRRTDVRVRSNETEELQFRLSPPLEERVQVVGGRSVVDLDQVGSSTRFSDEFIEGLPSPGRFYQDLLPLAPGIKDDDGDGNPNVHGSRTRDFRTEVSGVSNVDPLTGQWLSRINPDSIEELEILTVGAGAEFGRAQGGFARILQKQGTNRYQGVFNFLYRSSELDGDGAGGFDPLTQPPEFETIQPSFQFSGPLVKDRLWFRLSHELIDREDPVNLLGAGTVTKREQSLNADQLTLQASPRNKLALQYQYDPLTLTGLGISSRVPLESSRTLERGGPTWSLSWTAPYSDRVLFESVVAFQDHSVDVIPTSSPDQMVRQDCARFPRLFALSFTRCDDLTNDLVSGPYPETSLDERTRVTVKTQLTLYQRFGAQSHRFKFGFIYEDEKYERELIRRPDVAMEIVTPFLGDPYALLSARVFMPFQSKAKAEGRSWAMYLEDQWKPTNGLSLTAGLRLDREEITSLGREQFDPAEEADAFHEALGDDPLGVSRSNRYEIGKRVFTSHENIRQLRAQLGDALGINPIVVHLSDVMFRSQSWLFPRRLQDVYITNTNLSPRVALAWDPWANGKTKLSASYGRYYDKIFLAIPLVELEPVETLLGYNAEFDLFDSPRFTADDDDLVLAPVTVKTVDRNLRTPYQDEWALTFEREIFNETSAKLTWLERRFRDQFQDIDINQQTGDFGACGFVDFFGPLVPIPSPGEGQILFNPLTFEAYRDEDPGLGDGRLDDCTGQVGAGFGAVTFFPDGVPDLYLLNPAWREILRLGNYNTSDYNAFIFEVVRRQFRGWELQGSYTWSKARGDAEDYDLLLGNEQILREDEAGYLDHDQRHVVKLNVTTRTPWGIRAGAVIRWETGFPYSILTSTLVPFNIPPLYPYTREFDPFNPQFTALPRFRYPTHQRNDHRNPAFWTFDILLAKEFRFGRQGTFQLTGEVFNLLNDDTLRLRSRTESLVIGERRFGRQFQLSLRLAF